MPVVATRVGPLLVLVGAFGIVAGFFLQFAAEYSLFSGFPYAGGDRYATYQHLADLAYILEGAGVLVTGIAWSWIHLARSSPTVREGGVGRFRTRVGIALVLCGSAIFAAWAIIWAAIVEYDLAGGRLSPGVLFESGYGLFAGVGLTLWGVGWFVVRFNSW